MPDLKKVLKGLTVCTKPGTKGCYYDIKECPYDEGGCRIAMMRDALELLKEQEKENKALHLLVEWAEECDFGFDQFQNEYERYKDEIKDMKYIDGMIHIAKRTLEDQWAFAEGR